MGESCSSHEECDVALACRRQWSWPYKTMCRTYANTGDYCDDDYDCQPKDVCIFELETDSVKKCFTRYSSNDNK